MPGRSTFLDGYLPYVLRQADQALSAPFYAVLADAGVARSEWRVMAVLHELGPLRVLDLAEAALSPQPTVTHALRRLEKRELAVRTPGVHDRRHRVVSLTPAGSELTQSLISTATTMQAQALADTDALTELAAQLRALTDTTSRGPND